MKISISGSAAAYASASEDEITGSAALQRFSGVRSVASCIDYLDETLGRIGLIGGFLEFVFDEADQRLRICTEYHSPRELKPRELTRLVDETRGQWSDGIGESAFDAYEQTSGVRLDPYPSLRNIPIEDVRVEQMDDGVPVARPRVSPLFNAARKNDVAKIEKLLNSGEDINATDRSGSTPLLEAVRTNQKEAAKLLIERGGALDRADKCGSTPVVTAAMFHFNEILEALLQAGADPDYCDPQDYTKHPPLHMACNRKNHEAVRILVAHGADVNIRCDTGYSALMYLKKEDLPIARFLVEHGADIELKDTFGKGMSPALKAVLR